MLIARLQKELKDLEESPITNCSAGPLNDDIKIYFVPPVYHCNINKRGGICLDILNTSWSPALTIGKVLISICSLLAEPNPEDPLVPSIANLYKENRDLHDANAREFTIRHA